MNKSEAIQAHDKLRVRLEKDFPNPVARDWAKANLQRPEPQPYPQGDGTHSEGQGWIFVYKTDPDPDPRLQGKPFEAIIVRATGEAYLVLGACARIMNACNLGLPHTQERFLGSTRGGKYQQFDHGMAVWEGEPDLGYGVCYEQWGLSPGGMEKTAICTGFVAFSDLRGFTNWCQKKSTSAAKIQKKLSEVERCFQQAFSRTWCTSLFVKGTGDGMMIVSEADSSDQSIPNHAKEFTRACCRFVRDAQGILPKELAIGIGADFGEFYRFFILGRRDYVGMRINDAAKIQQLAWNEVVISDHYASRLRKDSINIDAISQPLPGKGYRLDVQSFLGQDHDV
jgi:class 3 adenylate cyclase